MCERFWVSIYYAVIYLTIRSPGVSKPRDWLFEKLSCSAIWRAPTTETPVKYHLTVFDYFSPDDVQCGSPFTGSLGTKRVVYHTQRNDKYISHISNILHTYYHLYIMLTIYKSKLTCHPIPTTYQSLETNLSIFGDISVVNLGIVYVIWFAVWWKVEQSCEIQLHETLHVLGCFDQTQIYISFSLVLAAWE